MSACVVGCARTDTRPYAEGLRCPDHTPARRAGQPEPDAARYCAPSRCYCRECPSWNPNPTHLIGETVLDVRAVASGKRRSSLAQYRSAQQNMTSGAA